MAMETDDSPPPMTIAQKLATIPAGKSRLFMAEEALPESVQSVISRTGQGDRFVTKRRDGGLRVWRVE